MTSKACFTTLIALLAVILAGPQGQFGMRDIRAGADYPPRHLNLVTASPAVKVAPSSRTVQVGDTFATEIWVEDAVDLGGYDFIIRYEPGVLAVLDVEDGSFLGQEGRSVLPIEPTYPTTSTVAFGAVSLPPPSSGVYGDGRLAIITLQALADGTSPLDLVDDEVSLFVTTSDDPVRPVTITDGTVTVESAVTNTPPSISSLPDQILATNSTADDAIDLWFYADDPEDADDELTFTISNAPAPGAGVTIDSNRYIDINPATDWMGLSEVEVQVMDTGGLTDTDSFRVTVGTYHSVYLPLVISRWPPLPYQPTVSPISNPDGTGSYVVSWTEQPSRLADTYSLQEATDTLFTTEVRDVCTTASQSCSVTGRSAGTYYYRVRGHNSWGYGPYSGPKSVVVLPPATPTLNPISNLDGDGAYTVSWTTAARANTYVLQEATNPDFTGATGVYDGPNLSWGATGRSVGTYHYRVRAAGPTGNSEWSNSRSVTVVPPPLPGDNEVCKDFGQVQLCASVSNATPSQYSTVTVYGRYLVNGAGQAGHTMDTTWHYKTTTSYCDGTTNHNGIAYCSRKIGRATKGYRVNVDVKIAGYKVTTWFSPH